MIDELKRWPHFVVCRADKVPLNPLDGTFAKSNDPTTWSDFDTAVACIKRIDGLMLGFMLSVDDPFAVIDLDNPRKESLKLTPEQIERADTMHNQIFEQFDSYSEKSPSGKGLHIWVRGAVETGKNNREYCVEVYSSGRFMTVTGWSHHLKPIEPRQELLTALWSQMGGKSIQDVVPTIDGEQTSSDERIIELCGMGDNGNGELFKRLYSGNWNGDYSSQSEADISLCNIVAFYSDSREQVGRIYWASPLFLNSDKRKRKAKQDYLFHADWGIVTKAFDRKGPSIFDIEKTIVESKRIEAIEVAEDEPIDDVELDNVDWRSLMPDGLTGEIARFIHSNSPFPMQEVAIAASIAYLAGICGRSWNYSKTGLNQYIVILAETGQGKEAAASGMDRITHEVCKTMPAFNTFMGPSTIPSAEGLIKQLNETPCYLTHKGEFGLWLQKLTGKYARANETNLRAALMDLYTKSGYTQTLRGASYSDRAKNIPSINAPSLSLFGDSTQQEFFKGLDEENIGEGFVPRLTVMQCRLVRPTWNPNHGKMTIDVGMIERIKHIAQMAMQLEKLAPIMVSETPEAATLQEEYRELCMNKVWKDQASPIAKLWSRAHIRVLKLAGVIAVGRRPDMPMVESSDIEFAKTIVNHSVDVIERRFKAGTVGSEINLHSEQQIAVGRVLRNYLKAGYKDAWVKLYGIDKQMYKANALTNRYLQANTTKHACFRKDRNPASAYKNALQSFVDNGHLVRQEMHKIPDCRKTGVAYYITDINGLPT